MPMNVQEQVNRLNDQVIQLYRQGEYERAIPIAIQACDLARHHFGEKHPTFATSLNNLALLYKATGRYAEVEPMCQQVLAIDRMTVGEHHPDYATSLTSLAELYHSMGKYAEAEPLYQQALHIRGRTLGNRSLHVAQSLDNLAELYRSMGKYAEAEPLYQQALAIYDATNRRHDWDRAITLDNFALLYKAMGRHAEAAPLLLQVLEIRGRILGKRHPRFAMSLNSLGELYYAMGKSAEAEPLYRQALEIRQRTLPENHPDVAMSLNNLAILYDQKGRYTEAEPLYQRALEIIRLDLGESSPAFNQTLNNLAVLYYAMGDLSKAEELYHQVLVLKRRGVEENSPKFAVTLGNLAALYQTTGNVREAERLLQEAMKIILASKGSENADFARYANNLGLLYLEMGDFNLAESSLRLAWMTRFRVLGEHHPDYANSLASMAALYDQMGRYDLARKFYLDAFNSYLTAMGKDHPHLAVLLDNFAGLCIQVGDYDEAEQCYLKAQDILRLTVGEEHPDVACNMHNLAFLHRKQGKYIDAEQGYHQALEITRNTLGEKHPEFARTLNGLSQLYVATNRLPEALSMMERAIAIEDLMTWQIFSIGSESRRMSYLRTLQGQLDMFLSLVLEYFPDAHEAARSGLDFVLRRKAIGAEALAVQRDSVLGDRYPDLKPMLQELTSLRMQIAQKTLAGPSSEGSLVHDQRLHAWNARKDSLEAEMARRIPEMSLEQKLHTANCHSVAHALPEGAVLVEFVRFDVFDFKAIPTQGEQEWKPAHYLAFILSAGEPEQVRMIDLGGADAIDERIATFRRTVTGETENQHTRHMKAGGTEVDQATARSSGESLRQAVFDPLLMALAGCTHLFLAPDGDLTRLPFEVLPSDDGCYLIDNYRISYLSVGRDILRFGATSIDQSSAPLVVAAPDFDLGGESATTSTEERGTRGGRRSRELERNLLRFDPLPGAGIEGEQIAVLLGVSPLLKEAAVEAAIKVHRSPRILHFATHGFFLPDQKVDPNQEQLSRSTASVIGRLSSRLENPLLRSGLALAAANTWLKGGIPPLEAEDGLLTAEDVSGLDLLATELVVLSACETGLGEVHVGEGVFGLRRAFMLAGARTLVMSLWKVPDQQTQELMEEFYRRVLVGQARADALREAQLVMKEKYPHPYNWGAFICQGDPGPLAWQQPSVFS